MTEQGAVEIGFGVRVGERQKFEVVRVLQLAERVRVNLSQRC